MHISDYWYFSQQSWFQLVLHPARHFAWCTLYISEISRWPCTALTYSCVPSTNLMRGILMSDFLENKRSGGLLAASSLDCPDPRKEAAAWNAKRYCYCLLSTLRGSLCPIFYSITSLMDQSPPLKGSSLWTLKMDSGKNPLCLKKSARSKF